MSAHAGNYIFSCSEDILVNSLPAPQATLESLELHGGSCTAVSSLRPCLDIQRCLRWTQTVAPLQRDW